MCPLEAQEEEKGRGELYGAIVRRARDGDRWAKIARANEHEKKRQKETRRGKERCNRPTSISTLPLMFLPTTGVERLRFQRFSTPAVLCITLAEVVTWAGG